MDLIVAEGLAIDSWALIARLGGSIDWAQLAAGLIVAVLLVLLAAEYRRRVIVA
jgi:hypothetical protein